MKNRQETTLRRLTLAALVVLAGCSAGAQTPPPQERDPARAGTENGQWTYPGGDVGMTRYSPNNQINAQNVGQLTEAWSFTDTTGIGSFQPGRGGASYMNGKLINVMGADRHVISLDPATGKKIWDYVEPTTPRREYSMRAAYGKGVAWANIPGRGEVIYMSTPAFFLHAIDANTGRPLANWGRRVNIPGFPQTGVADMLEDIVRDWQPWTSRNTTYDAAKGMPLEIGYITNSSPPIVVNGVVVVGNSAEQGYAQTGGEAIPPDILGYDAATGALKWRFHTVPRAGEFGAETWENNRNFGETSSWAPMAADPSRNLVFINTNSGTVDYFGGHRPGNNLFGTSIIALNVQTGQRVWHYQFVHHDIWNYDTSTAPILMDVTVNGQRIPGVFQATKQAFLYAFNRTNGQPIWPMPERPVPASRVPGEKLSPTQPHPTLPAPYDLQGRTEAQVIDWSPQIRQLALERVRATNQLSPFFVPPVHAGDPLANGPARICPGDVGGTNITHPPAADPTTGIIYLPSVSGCTNVTLEPGVDVRREADSLVAAGGHVHTGTTIVGYVRGSGAGGGGGGGGAAGRAAGAGRAGAAGAPATPPPADPLAGIPSMFKGPNGRITAIDLNTGQTLWTIPYGDAPRAQQDACRANALVVAANAQANCNYGRTNVGGVMVTATLLFSPGQDQNNANFLFAIDKRTGQRVAQIPVAEVSRYGMMTYMHQGRQYIVMQMPNRLQAFALPASN